MFHAACSAIMLNSGSLVSFDVAVIGGGPAGLTAAIYLARFLRSVVVFDAGDARARIISKTRNCPGFPDGIAGTELLKRLREQAEGFGASVHNACVQRVEGQNGSFILSGTSPTMCASRVVVATGIVDKAPVFPFLSESIARGAVCLCPVCDAYEAKGKRIGVLGPEQRALPEALFLRDFSNRIAILSRRPGDVSSATRMKAAAAGIEIWDFVHDLTPTDFGFNVVMSDGTPAHEVDIIYPAMGCDVRSELAVNLGAEFDDEGYLLVGTHLETSVRGLYAIGDVAKALNQIAVGFGHAATAATHIHQSLGNGDCYCDSEALRSPVSEALVRRRIGGGAAIPRHLVLKISDGGSTYHKHNKC